MGFMANVDIFEHFFYSDGRVNRGGDPDHYFGVWLAIFDLRCVVVYL